MFLGLSPWLLPRVKIVIKTEICEWQCFLECSPLLQPGYDVSVSREQPGWRTTSWHEKGELRIVWEHFFRIGQDLSGLLILENLAPLTPQVDMALKSQWIMCEAVVITTFILDHPPYCSFSKPVGSSPPRRSRTWLEIWLVLGPTSTPGQSVKIVIKMIRNYQNY